MFARILKFGVLSAAVAFAAFSGNAAQAQFGRSSDAHRRHGSARHDRVQALARQLEREARFLDRETDGHFRRTPGYRQFEAEVDQIVRLADHINDVARRGRSLDHLRDDVAKLDRLYHASERLFEAMVRGHRLDRETVVHVRQALGRVERTVHALRAEL